MAGVWVIIIEVLTFGALDLEYNLSPTCICDSFNPLTTGPEYILFFILFISTLVPPFKQVTDKKNTSIRKI